MLTIIATIAAFTYIIACWVALLAIHRAPIERKATMHHHHYHNEFLLIIEGTSPVGDVRFRTAPLPLGVAMGAAARMVDSPTPARIVPATPANLDRYPALVDTSAVVVWLFQHRPAPVAKWNESSLVSSN